MTELKFTSYNVRGLTQSKKRRKVFSFLHNQKRDIFLIQESHSIKGDSNIWQNEWGGKIVFAHGSSSSRGVCILFNPALSVNFINIKSDTNGRYIIIDAMIHSKSITIICVYAPNIDSPSFFDSLSAEICNFACENVVMGGDFNLVFDLQLDKIGGVQQTNFRARDQCLDLMNRHGLIDVWRERNPHAKVYTWSSNITVGIHCRFDFFLISSHLIKCISNVTISPSLQSDHRLVNCNLQLFSEKRGFRVLEI